MSVAFRRESDEEHLEPKFELPLPPGPNLVTARGLALIEARADALETGNNGNLALTHAVDDIRTVNLENAGGAMCVVCADRNLPALP